MIAAKLRIAQGREELALDELAPWIESDTTQLPNLGYARLLYGTALRNLGRMTEAAAYLAERETKPEWNDAWSADTTRFAMGFTGERIRASSLYRKQEFDRALAMFGRLVENPQADYRDWSLLAACQLAKGQVEPAIASLERAIELNPEIYASYMNLARARLAYSSTYELEQLEPCIALLQKAIELRPDKWEPYDALGQILQVLDRNEEALSFYTQAVERLPQLGIAQWRKIFLLIEMNRWDDVRTQLETFQPPARHQPIWLIARAKLAHADSDWRLVGELIGQVDLANIEDENLRLDFLRLRGLWEQHSKHE